jgi:hypothetical protein
MASADDVWLKLEEGRAAMTCSLRELADRIDALTLEEAGEVLTSFTDQIAELQHQADRILRR